MRSALIAGMLLAWPCVAAPRTYDLPEEPASLRPGPGLELVQQNCTACHSSDYISTQPRPLRDPHAFWQAEVVKMKSVYGAPIEPGDVPKLVDYLAETYGK